MVFREVSVIEVREALRAWLGGKASGRWPGRPALTARQANAM